MSQSMALVKTFGFFGNHGQLTIDTGHGPFVTTDALDFQGPLVITGSFIETIEFMGQDSYLKETR